jgi:hypothetical protein
MQPQSTTAKPNNVFLKDIFALQNACYFSSYNMCNKNPCFALQSKKNLFFGKNGAGTSVANQDLSNQDSRPTDFVDQKLKKLQLKAKKYVQILQ